MPFPISQMSPDTRVLADRLQAVPIGETVTFADLSAALGADVLARRYLILGAMKVANAESGAIFLSVRGAGYKRLPPQEVATLGAHIRRRMRSSSSRATRAIARTLEIANDMPDDARRKAYAEMNALALIRHIATDKAVATMRQTAKPEPVAVTMRAMMAAIGAPVA